MSGKVLVVEDDESIRRLLIEFFREQSGLEVDGACDGVEALHCVATESYRVVVLDLMMPYMTGIDFLDSLAAMLSDSSVHAISAPPNVIIITSAPEEQVPAETIQQRFPSIVRAVLRKPLDIETLARRVMSLLDA